MLFIFLTVSISERKGNYLYYTWMLFVIISVAKCNSEVVQLHEVSVEARSFKELSSWFSKGLNAEYKIATYTSYDKSLIKFNNHSLRLTDLLYSYILQHRD